MVCASSTLNEVMNTFETVSSSICIELVWIVTGTQVPSIRAMTFFDLIQYCIKVTSSIVRTLLS